MLHQISTENYKNVYKIIRNAPHSIFAGSVCAGNNPGWVLGDDPVHPASAFVYTCGLGGTLVGKWDNKEFVKTFIERLDADILHDASIKHTDLLKNDISDWWTSIDTFLSNGFGFTAIHNNTICGWCYSVCVLENRAEIYIETLQEFQNKGIGYALSRNMVEYCLQHNFQPEWEAFDQKDFSVKIAEKLGYEMDYEYNVYEVKI